jgi:hypothetical protein
MIPMISLSSRCALLLCAFGSTAMALDSGDSLRAGFQDPPNSARPRVWWHWMNGNITQEGIKLDLEWMHRTGIGGFQNFDAALGTPPVVAKRLVYMTPEWRDAFRYATTLADQLGLEEAIAGSPGWSESGGPWVKPQQAMKKVVWSETVVEGGTHFKGVLPRPPGNGGPFQDAPYVLGLGETSYVPPAYYSDTLVIASRIADVEVAQPMPVVTASSGTIDGKLLYDGEFSRSVALPMAPVGESSWILFDYGQPQTLRALSFAPGEHAPMDQFFGAPPGPELQASDDGTHFRSILSVAAGSNSAEVTVAFAPVTARYFRAVFLTLPQTRAPVELDFESLGFQRPVPSTHLLINELALHTGARVHHFEDKAGFGLQPDLSTFASPAVPAALAAPKVDVVDLTAKLQADGTLDWIAPPGHWVVQRFGYSLLGITNHPASPEGTGLEVDKLSATHVRSYMAHYLDSYKSAVGSLLGKHGLQYLISDSYEAGPANWTDDMLAQFTRRRGYDPKPWFPALTGRVVESAAASDRFLWDYRQTLGELIAENHYQLITTLLKQRGMGHYGESHESGRVFVGDGMDAKRSNDVPMSAMWTQYPGVNADQPGYNADIRESASVAHIYGQNLVAAESLTAAAGAWMWSPETLKPTADKELAMGLNRFVIHTSVHQPLVDKGPGIGLGPFGQWFTRNETWSGAGAKAWVDYLARSSFLLQQGHFVADIAYFYGEDSNITALFGKAGPAIPEGYNFDYVNADALLHKLGINNGELTTVSGMRYRVLALDAHSVHMSLPVLRRIRELVNAGAVVVGPRPLDTPSLADDVTEFRSGVRALWGDTAGVHAYGKGRVYSNMEVGAALADLKLAADFVYSRPQADTQLLAVHRRLADGELYFVTNRAARVEELDATFRVSGRTAELWHADTGKSEPAAYRAQNGRTTVPLKLQPWESVFVVFRKPGPPSHMLPATAERLLTTLNGPWTVKLQAGRGAPADFTSDALESWSVNNNSGVKYFSGTGTYTRNLQAPAAWISKTARLWLELGDVKNIAEVSVNGRDLGVLWKAPFRVDITAALHAGDNQLQIKVTNLWVNRMIGDRQAGVEQPVTFTVPKFYKADSPLLPSGLLGPVRLFQETTP